MKRRANQLFYKALIIPHLLNNVVVKNKMLIAEY